MTATRLLRAAVDRFASFVVLFCLAVTYATGGCHTSSIPVLKPVAGRMQGANCFSRWLRYQFRQCESSKFLAERCTSGFY